MTVHYIPLGQDPSQHVVTSINGNTYNITTRQMGARQYISIKLNGDTICNNVLLTDRQWVIRARYLFDLGDFMPIDMQGTDNPTYDGWGTRYYLMFDDSPVYEEDYVDG